LRGGLVDPSAEEVCGLAHPGDLVLRAGPSHGPSNASIAGVALARAEQGNLRRGIFPPRAPISIRD